jgi:hypothetical protein
MGRQIVLFPAVPLFLRSDIGFRLLDVTPCSHFTPLPPQTQTQLEPVSSVVVNALRFILQIEA